jgi:hypothetical protein
MILDSFLPFLFTFTRFAVWALSALSFTSGPSGRAGRPSAALCGHGRRRGCHRAGCPGQGLPLCRRGFGNRLLTHAGSAAAGQIARAARWAGSGRRRLSLLAGAGTGMTDRSRVRLAAGSPSSPPWARSAMSFLAATLLAFEVRWTPSTAQMLVPSTVVKSWGRDSQEPKKLRILSNLAFPVRSPMAAAFRWGKIRISDELRTFSWVKNTYFLLCGSRIFSIWIRERNFGSGINIPDPQHCS